MSASETTLEEISVTSEPATDTRQTVLAASAGYVGGVTGIGGALLSVDSASAGKRRDDLQRLTDARIERMDWDVDAIDKRVVPRGEHQEMWAALRALDADPQRQADQNRQGLYDLNTPRDTIQGMQRRIDELEKRRQHD